MRQRCYWRVKCRFTLPLFFFLPFLSFFFSPPLILCRELRRAYRRRGKRRISLPKLLAANSPNLIQSTTTSAFALLTSLQAAPSTETILAALKVLVDAIKGVGPATASYILALIAPAHVPVFSDEGYRWVLHTNGGKGNDGWYREIKYDLKEYRAYLDLVKALTGRLGDGVTAQDVEKVGFVLGKEAAAELTGGKIGGESAAATKARIMASKKLTGAEALDTALGVVETNTVPAPAPPAGVQSPATGILGPASLGLLIFVSVTQASTTSKAPTSTSSKRKKPDPHGSDVDTDDIPLPRSKKVRVGGSARKKSEKKMGLVNTRKK